MNEEDLDGPLRSEDEDEVEPEEEDGAVGAGSGQPEEDADSDPGSEEISAEEESDESESQQNQPGPSASHTQPKPAKSQRPEESSESEAGAPGVPAHMTAFINKQQKQEQQLTKSSNQSEEEVDEWSDDEDIGYRKVPVEDYYFNQYPDEFEDDDGTDGHYETFFTNEDKGDKEKKDSEPQFDSFNLKVFFQKNKTGFEESKDFPIKIGSMIAGRYEIKEYLGSAAFSKAIQCLDTVTKNLVCIKIITNNKDFFDQSLDEIKLLTYINSNADPDQMHVLQLYDYFYFKEHLFIVCELLRDNLYEFYKYNRDCHDPPYFTMTRLRHVAHQCLTGLAYIHSLNLIHCDLKPENILMKSYSRCQVKIIDFGSSCFTNDHLSSYVQSRAYRAPEVILGLPYDQKIDIWSLGCILAELWTGNVLFLNDSVQTLLARVNGIIGPFPKEMLDKGRHARKFYTKRTNILYERPEPKGSLPVLIYPKKTTLKARLKGADPHFLDFITKLLKLRPSERPSAAEALQHPWLASVPDEPTSFLFH